MSGAPRVRGLARIAAACALAFTPLSGAAQQPRIPAEQVPQAWPDTTLPGGGMLRRLSLEEALGLGQQASDGVDIAAAGLAGARGRHKVARSQYFPQIGGSGGYTKTLLSQFSDLGTTVDSTVAPLPALCAPLIPATATPAERAAALAQASSCASSGGGFDFSQTGFGASNQWTLGLTLAQNVFTGGRVRGQVRVASAQVRSAQIDVSSQRAQTALDVTGAYFDAVLADQLVLIAQEALEQTDVVLTQTRLGRQVGQQSEFELLRAQVTRDNQKPPLIQALATRDVAYLRLKQLIGMPLEDSLDLTTQIDEAPPELPTELALVAAATAEVTPPSEAEAPFVDSTGVPLADTAVDVRAAVRQVHEAIETQEAQLQIARSERLPTVSIVSGFQRLYFPTDLLPALNDARQNWTVGVQASIPIFTGGRVSGDEDIARAALEQTRAELNRARKLTALDTHVALDQLRQADATFEATQGTAEQALRAYEIDQVRYREGISTQTDLTQTRLLLEQARASRARAARDRAVARVRLALLRNLPLQSGSLGAANGPLAAAASASAALAVQQMQQQQVNPSAGAAPAAGGVFP